MIMKSGMGDISGRHEPAKRQNVTENQAYALAWMPVQTPPVSHWWYYRRAVVNGRGGATYLDVQVPTRRNSVSKEMLAVNPARIAGPKMRHAVADGRAGTHRGIRLLDKGEVFFFFRRRPMRVAAPQTRERRRTLDKQLETWVLTD